MLTVMLGNLFFLVVNLYEFCASDCVNYFSSQEEKRLISDI